MRNISQANHRSATDGTLRVCPYNVGMPEAWVSPVKQKLREGRPVFAATVSVNSTDVAAHLATAGFDFLWVEMEHSPVTLDSRRNMVLATRGLAAQTFARVPVNEIW